MFRLSSLNLTMISKSMPTQLSFTANSISCGLPSVLFSSQVQKMLKVEWSQELSQQWLVIGGIIPIALSMVSSEITIMMLDSVWESFQQSFLTLLLDEL